MTVTYRRNKGSSDFKADLFHVGIAVARYKAGNFNAVAEELIDCFYFDAHPKGWSFWAEATGVLAEGKPHPEAFTELEMLLKPKPSSNILHYDFRKRVPDKLLKY